MEGWVTGLEVHSSVGGARPGQEAWVVGFCGDGSLLIVTPGSGTVRIPYKTIKS